MLPSGLGVTDAGYVVLLGAYGVPDPTVAGAAFVLLERAKEVSWCLAGTAILVLLGSARPTAELETAPSPP